MLRRLIYSLTFLAVALIAAPQVRADAVADVEAATGQWISAFNRKDAKAIVTLYAKDAVFFGTSSPVLRDNPDLVWDYFKSLPSLGDATITMDEHRVQLFGRTAINSGYYTRHARQDGQTSSNPARFSFVYEKRNGKWWIVNHHSSALPVAAPPTPPPATAVIVQPDRLTWATPPGIPDLRSAWLVGKEDQAGSYAIRVVLKAGGRITPHTHPDTRFSTVMSGVLYVGFGAQTDETKLLAVPAGAVYVAPANTPHYLWAKDGEVVYQESGIGPTGTALLPAVK
jgi:uncharacterized protein (TIGR02246 family)